MPLITREVARGRVLEGWKEMVRVAGTEVVEAEKDTFRRAAGMVSGEVPRLTWQVWLAVPDK
jgi:hypothetical protein